MFLAIKEIIHSKLRYGLVIGLVFLIAYLVFFLTGLAYGLALDNRTAVDKWDADYILLAEESNSNLSMSMVPRKDLDKVEGKEKALLAQTPGVVTQEGKEDGEKITVSFFGINKEEFIMPEVIEGKAFESDAQAVADISLKDEYQVDIGDKIKLSGNKKIFEIVGFTKDAKFNVSPVLYISIPAYQEVRFEKTDLSENARLSGVVVKGDVGSFPDDMENISISSFINDLPGYNAQVLTFGFMIGFLIVIAAIVIGIFIYVLTMQKINIFGVMKAQGISSAFIAKSIIAQTFILSAVGILLGLFGTYLTSVFLPSTVPFQSNPVFLGAISLLMLIVAILAAFFSVRAIVKIDPLRAIG